MPILLDTSVLIDVLRDRPAKDRLRALKGLGEVPYICGITAEEVQRGLRPSEVERANRLLAGFRVAAIRVPEGALAGQWRREFAERGITLSQPDCLIAAAALSVRATLATGNPKHFPMREIAVEHWPVGT
jgi:hypothetical protein